MAQENNAFLNVFDAKNMTTTENGALSKVSTLSVITDQFGKAGNYRERNIEDVFADMDALWNENQLYALRFVFYLRMVTRKTTLIDGDSNATTTESVQKGQGARDEVYKRLLWLAKYQPMAFYENIWVLPFVGSWKDMWMLMYYDEKFDLHCIDRKDIIFNLINWGLSSKASTDLVKKYMPRIKPWPKCKTDWTIFANKIAREFANYCHLSYKDYNHLKTSGCAHDFQKIICDRRYPEIEWNKIPGKALNILAGGKFLSRHCLTTAFTEWVMAQPTVKFTGYVCDLYRETRAHMNKMPLYKKILTDKQFDELIAKAEADGKIKGNVWCALDTSGSMGIEVTNKYRAIDICVSLGIFFSTLNKGAFHKNVIMFDSVSRVLQLEGTFTDMVNQISNENIAWGNTNFQSVIDEIIRIRKTYPNIPLEEYPQTLLVVSDMQFDVPSNMRETNYEAMKRKLYEVFPQDFVDGMKFIWWDCASRKSDFPSTVEDSGTYFFSGFDGSILQMLLGDDTDDTDTEKKPTPSMEELIEKALSQEILQYILV
jgi:hypothetical protein